MMISFNILCLLINAVPLEANWGGGLNQRGSVVPYYVTTHPPAIQKQH
jgi:hypothetical protein